MRFKQITIVGTGLIGGSLGMAFKAHALAGRIVGCDRDGILTIAQKLGAIDEAITDLTLACVGSDLIVLAMPVSAIIDALGRLPKLAEGTLVTDVGSTKREICETAKKVWGEGASTRFLPGHPMAGKAEGGIENASATLFRDAAWLLAPLQEPLTENAANLVAALQAIGARPMMCGIEEHDRMCAYVSHLPQLVATALANVVDETELKSGELESHQLAGAGLRSMTRLAASPYSMWRDIALTNADHIAEALQKMEQRLAHLRENLKSPELRAEFEKAQAARAMLK